jgi:peptidoglycan-associated lipoprotein
MKRLAMIFWPAMTIAACSTPLPPAAPPAPPAAPAPSAVQSAPPPVAKPMKVATISPQEQFERMLAGLNGKSIYFDYDQYLIKPDEDALISQQAKLLDAYSQGKVTVQGNCDERGSSEYNLALGQRRADEVKQKLELLGVPASRIETVSFGKEKPRALCHEESCWKENRRADFVDAWSSQNISSR